MHLLGFAFAPRIRDLHDKWLFIHGKTELYPGLQSIISATSLNLKEIETHWNEVLRLASYLKQNGSGKGAEIDWAYRKVIVYAGLVQGPYTASTRTGGAE